MKRNIFITYCCKDKKRISVNYKVTPAELYSSSRVQKFINFCNSNNYCWAIFSDKYGLVFGNEKISWYNKSPDMVTSVEYNRLLNEVIIKLQDYEIIYFYYSDNSFQSLYKHLAEHLAML